MSLSMSISREFFDLREFPPPKLSTLQLLLLESVRSRNEKVRSKLGGLGVELCRSLKLALKRERLKEPSSACSNTRVTTSLFCFRRHWSSSLYWQRRFFWLDSSLRDSSSFFFSCNTCLQQTKIRNAGCANNAKANERTVRVRFCGEAVVVGLRILRSRWILFLPWLVEVRLFGWLLPELF